MKIATTITKEERAKTYNAVYIDPCRDIECTGIDCDDCPLQKAAEELRKAQETFINILNSFVVEG